jgi:hypothetical protein
VRIQLTLVALLFLCGCEYVPGTRGNLFRQSKDILAEGLIGPSSPLFRNFKVGYLEDGDAYVCGEVNAKNRFGAYAGHCKFMVMLNDFGKVSGAQWVDELETSVQEYENAGQMEAADHSMATALGETNPAEKPAAAKRAADHELSINIAKLGLKNFQVLCSRAS